MNKLIVNKINGLYRIVHVHGDSLIVYIYKYKWFAPAISKFKLFLINMATVSPRVQTHVLIIVNTDAAF